MMSGWIYWIAYRDWCFTRGLLGTLHARVQDVHVRTKYDHPRALVESWLDV
jgi:hypothetical protein